MDQRPFARIRTITLPLVVLAFLGGIFVERFGIMPGSRAYIPAHLGQTFDPFWEAWKLVEQHYVDRDAVQPKKMTHGAIEGMLSSLGDYGHTTFLTREELEQLKASLKGNLQGIGARMTVRKQQPTIMHTMPGSPARMADLRPGDVLLEVDGKSVSGLPLSRVAEKVRGVPGTTVALRVARDVKGKKEVLSFHIVRARVEVPAVIARVFQDVPIAHIAIHEFGEQADAQLKAAVEAARKGGAKALIVDLRGNQGGLKDQAVAVTSEFLKDGVVFIEENAEGRREAIAVEPGGVATDLPLVLLIDEGSASSSEIFAGAIQDHHRGKLVGTTTFGTGTVLQGFVLSDESVVMLAVAKWLTPDGRQIWHHGITPDVEMPLPPGAAILLPDDEADLTVARVSKSEDLQLRRALDIALQAIGRKPAAAVGAGK
jgi:carboxyl-terminal processing protease